MKKIIFAQFIIALLFLSCQSTQTASFNAYSYQKTIEIKVLSTYLMDKSTQPYSESTKEIDNLLIELAKITEYEKNRPNNQLSYAMWEMISNKEKNLLAGYLKFWKEKTIVSQDFKEEAKKQINKAFDLLIQYEIKKDKESQNHLIEYLTLNN